jgi:tripartite-type tricarboxylate transporter receptor subunit TctC
MVAGVDMLQVPYKGGSLAIIDLLGGQVDVTFASAASFVPMVRAGRLRALAITGPTRLSALPHVLTSKESGFPDFEVVGWISLAAPANTPKDVVGRLNREIGNVLKVAAIAGDLVNAGFEPVTNSPEEMTNLVKFDYARWGKVIKASGVKPQQ